MALERPRQAFGESAGGSAPISPTHEDIEQEREALVVAQSQAVMRAAGAVMAREWRPEPGYARAIRSVAHRAGNIWGRAEGLWGRVRSTRKEDVVGVVERFVSRHPETVYGAVAAGFLVGRYLKRSKR